MDVEELPMHKDTYFFGYGIDIEKPDEMARQIIKLKEENQELKKQLEDMTLCRDIASGHRKEVQDRETILLNQQKKFIEYLENEIKYWEEQEQQWIKLGFMKFGGEANNKIIFKNVLSKYKEIIGDEEEDELNGQTY